MQNEGHFLHTNEDLSDTLVQGCGFFTFSLQIIPKIKVLGQYLFLFLLTYVFPTADSARITFVFEPSFDISAVPRSRASDSFSDMFLTAWLHLNC